jgi:enamine deaminase RidA (YjgF/YER057c/UK114 family)
MSLADVEGQGPAGTLEHVVMPWGQAKSYSCAIKARGLIYTSGHLGAIAGGEVVPFREQARVALERLFGTIREAGGDIATIIKINAYLATMSDFPEWDEIYRATIPLKRMPARTSIGIGGFVKPLLLEVDAVALEAKQS